MCEPSCPLTRLETLKFSISALASTIGADNHGSYQRELAHLAAKGIQNELDWCIEQLKAAGEGERCIDLEAYRGNG